MKKVKLNLSLDVETKKRLQECADMQHKTISAFVTDCVWNTNMCNNTKMYKVECDGETQYLFWQEMQDARNIEAKNRLLQEMQDPELATKQTEVATWTWKKSKED